MKIANTLSIAAILLSATLALAQSSTQSSTQQVPAPNAAAPTKQPSPSTVKKAPAPKTQAEYEAYKAAASLTDPAKLEAAATDFAQKFPDSELRAFLFQQAMGLYQQANNMDKSLEMARVVLKYDPGNSVALLTAASLLAERTHDTDLDKDDRLDEAKADAESALQHANEVAQPTNMTPEQFAGALSQLRGTAHEVIGTVAFKRLDYQSAIREYNAAAGEERDHTEAVVWLRLSVAHDKINEYDDAMASVQKAIAASEPNSQIRQLAEQEKARLEKLASSAAKQAR